MSASTETFGLQKERISVGLGWSPALAIPYPLPLGKLYSLQAAMSSSTKKTMYAKLLEHCQAQNRQETQPADIFTD